jgi:hypothetical protein
VYNIPMSRRTLLVCIAALVGWSAVAAWHLLTPSMMWVTGFECVVTGLLAVGTVLTCWAIARAKHWASVALTSSILAANSAMIVATILGHNPLAVAPYGDGAYAVILCITGAIAIVGAFARKLWARWLLLGFGSAAVVGCVMNFIGYWPQAGQIYPQDMHWYIGTARSSWAFAISVVGGALMVMNMMSASSLFVATGVWQSRTSATRWLAVSIVAGIASTAMLLVFGFSDHSSAATRISALSLAVFLTGSLILLISGRTAGAVLLVLCGVGLVAQTLATFRFSADAQDPRYFAVFWLIGAAVAFVAGATLLRPALKILRAPRD